MGWFWVIIALILGDMSTVKAMTNTVVNTGDSGDGSLRWAIQQANANAGTDTIAFNIPGSGPHIIRPAPGPLVIASPNDGVFIDSYSQPGASPATETSPAVLKIELDGSLASGFGAGLPEQVGYAIIRISRESESLSICRRSGVATLSSV